MCLKINKHTEFLKKWTAAGRLNSKSGNMDFSKHYRIAEATQILECVKLYGHMAKPIEIGAISVTV